MTKPIKAEVVNAFMASLREIFLASTGIESELAPIHLTANSPPAPNMLVSIQISGGVNGPAICSFEPGVAREIAGRMLATDDAPEFDSPNAATPWESWQTSSSATPPARCSTRVTRSCCRPRSPNSPQRPRSSITAA